MRPERDALTVFRSESISCAHRDDGSEKSDSVRLELRQRYDLAKQSQGDHQMTTKALFVKLEAKPGKENEVAKFLREGQGLVQQEPATIAWFGIQLGPTTFAIFDAFTDDAGRDAHLSGKVAKALMEKAPELLAEPPKIEKADVLADRLLG
jgi:quinol monooxygenase YgiN